MRGISSFERGGGIFSFEGGGIFSFERGGGDFFI